MKKLKDNAIRMTVFLIFLFFQVLSFAGDKTEIEKDLIKAGLVNIQEIDPSLKVDLKYSSAGNFLHEDVYGDLNSCYLQKEAAQMLAAAQKNLKAIHSDYSLIIYDGVRPRRIQYKMWDIVKGTDQQGYVANPQYGSIHNYGCAVDLSITDEKGKALDMGTPFDFFGDLAQPRYEKKFLGEGKLTLQQVKNRELLRTVMTKAGFQTIPNEWWHFNAFPKETVKATYSIIE